MNEVGKMGRRNNKIPGSRMKSQKGLKQCNKLSKESHNKLKNEVKKSYKEYINSDANRKKQMKLQILIKCGLANNDSNKRRVVKFMSYEKKRHERKNEAPISVEGRKCRNRLSPLVAEEIIKFVVDNSYGIKYLKSKNRSERIEITKIVLNKFGIDNCPKNRKMIQDLILHTTYKPWSDEEEKALEELLREKINTVVWNETGDKNKTSQIKRQIIKDYKEKILNNEHNDRDIMYKIDLLVCKIKIKMVVSKPISVKSRESKPIRSRQIKPVQQNTRKMIGEEIQFNDVKERFNDVKERLCNQSPEESNDFGIDIDMFENCENYPVL